MLYPELQKEYPGAYDVVICGGGLAGLMQARQLKLTFPDIEILLLEKRSFPLQKEKFKVGESTVEASAFYLAETLKLKDYFKNNQFTKLGFRYFTGDGSKNNLNERPEIGLSQFAAFDTYQINRVILEDDLFVMNELAGITQLTNILVQDIILEKDKCHQVMYKAAGAEEGKTVFAKWVIDAMGRRCFIQRKRDTHIKSANPHSASWFWIKERIDIDDLVPRSDRAYHQRIAHNSRYFSTNHICGQGYWVWLIPLMGGYTSIGIVAAEKYHDFSTFNTKDKAIEWLRKHEPCLVEKIAGHDMINFSLLKNYSYSSSEVFSSDRWACIGEAAIFSDPYYSPGINVMSFNNTMVTNMIALDVKGQLTPQDAKEYSDYLIRLNDWLTLTIQSSYGYFHHPMIMALSTLWDIVVGWSFVMPDMINSIYLDRNKRKELQTLSSSFIAVIYKMNEFLLEWGERTQNSATFDFIDYLKIPFVAELYKRNIQRGRRWDQIIQDQKQNLKTLEEFSHVIFLMAVRDVLPEQLEKIPENCWLKIEAMTLNTERWNTKGIFQPTSEPSDYSMLKKQIEDLFVFTENLPVEEKLEAENSFSFNI